MQSSWRCHCSPNPRLGFGVATTRGVYKPEDGGQQEERENLLAPVTQCLCLRCSTSELMSPTTYQFSSVQGASHLTCALASGGHSRPRRPKPHNPEPQTPQPGEEANATASERYPSLEGALAIASKPSRIFRASSCLLRIGLCA